MLQRVSVLLPLPLPGPLDYSVPEDLPVAPGDIVAVSLNGRSHLGVVWDTLESNLPALRLKPLLAIVEPFHLGATLRQFIDWVAGYTLSRPGDVLAMCLRVSALAQGRAVFALRRPDPAPENERVTELRQRVLDHLGCGTMAAGRLAEASGVSKHVLRAMVRCGSLMETQATSVELEMRSAAADAPVEETLLTPDQRALANRLCDSLRGGFSVTLLNGVTGSGKTEVYFEVVRACLATGRQALILLPEIALSAQWLQQFTQRFGLVPLLWHSELSSQQRRLTWRQAASGHAQVVVGARSALFLPLNKLGLIVVDEEHDTGYKQQDGVVYHARDMAVVRARLADAVVVLVSATPSLETLANVALGRYARLDLPKRFGGARIPAVQAIDLRDQQLKRGSFLSSGLAEALAKVLQRGEQAMLFLNRRGYAPLTLCRACGYRVNCRNCTAWLVEHRLKRMLTCHHCGQTQAVPTRCPACSAEHTMTAVGPGVERITEEVASLFPQARRLVMTSDTLTGPTAAAAAAALIKTLQVDIIIGTQVVAKGWHFPHLALVGVVDADLGLSGGDLRASERTMQLLHQVAGRAGRAQIAGTVLLQTYQPTHPVMRAMVTGNMELFMQAEAAARQEGHWPPFGRLAALIVSAEKDKDADAIAAALAKAAPRVPGVMVLGPAPAPLALLRGRHRRRLLLRAIKEVPLQPLLREWLAKVQVPNRVRVQVDVDPVSFL